MQFFSNKINVGKGKSFEELCQEYLKNKNQDVKTASTKTAAEEEAESSGQLDVEPLHQTGESTNQDSVAGGKSDEKKSPPSTKKQQDEEGKDSEQPKAEAKLTNDPKVESKEADTKSETKEAGKIKGPGVPDGTGPSEDCPYKEDKEDKDKEDKDKEDKDKEDKDKEAKDKEAKEQNKETKTAKDTKRFKKIANLTSEEKSRLGEYWKRLYPAEFVDAMLADK